MQADRGVRWVSFVLALLAGAFALLLLGVSMAFGRDGFGGDGSEPIPHETTVQVLLGAALVAPTALLKLRGKLSLAVPSVQALMIAVAMSLM